LRIVQAKLSGRVNSSAKQLISLRKLFQAYDFDNSGDLDENEFHECLEKCNIQLDDVQTLSLFSSFDRDYQGLDSFP
jgi:Ca2+-binding EF-hand superfamily protein